MRERRERERIVAQFLSEILAPEIQLKALGSKDAWPKLSAQAAGSNATKR